MTVFSFGRGRPWSGGPLLRQEAEQQRNDDGDDELLHEIGTIERVVVEDQPVCGAHPEK